MKPLTLEYAIENKFNGLDLVKYFNPNITNEAADFILWEKTCFPCCTETTIEQLNEMFKDKIEDEKRTNKKTKRGYARAIK